MEDLVSLGNLLSKKIMKPSRWLYATSSNWTPSATRFKEQSVKTTYESPYDRRALKPWNVYDIWKKTSQQMKKKPKYHYL
jgi:hypothetical protein